MSSMTRTYSNPDLAAALGKPPAALLHDVKGLLPKPDRPGHRRLSLADCAVVALYLEAKRVGLAHYPARMIFGSGFTGLMVAELLARAGAEAAPAAFAKWLRENPWLIGAAFEVEGDPDNLACAQFGISATPFLTPDLPKTLAALRGEGGLRGTVFATPVAPALLRLIPMIEEAE